MNKDELRGYLLACCDEIDRGIMDDVWSEDDLLGQLSEKLRLYLSLDNKRICQYCGQQIDTHTIHSCWTRKCC